MLVNMWDAFCSLVFACGGFSNLFISGGCCASVCMRRVASVHAACVQVDGIKAAVPYFPCGFILCVGGLGFLMVFHLNTVGLVPVATPVTSLFILSLRLLHCLTTPEVSRRRLLLPGVSLIPTETHMHTFMHTVPQSVYHPNECKDAQWMILILCMYFTLFSVLY